MFYLFFILLCSLLSFFFFFFNDTATTEIYTLSLHDALPISCVLSTTFSRVWAKLETITIAAAPLSFNWCSSSRGVRSEEHTSELQSRLHLVCRLLLEKKKKNTTQHS